MSRAIIPALCRRLRCTQQQTRIAIFDLLTLLVPYLPLKISQKLPDPITYNPDAYLATANTESSSTQKPPNPKGPPRSTASTSQAEDEKNSLPIGKFTAVTANESNRLLQRIVRECQYPFLRSKIEWPVVQGSLNLLSTLVFSAPCTNKQLNNLTTQIIKVVRLSTKPTIANNKQSASVASKQKGQTAPSLPNTRVVVLGLQTIANLCSALLVSREQNEDSTSTTQQAITFLKFAPEMFKLSVDISCEEWATTMVKKSALASIGCIISIAWDALRSESEVMDKCMQLLLRCLDNLTNS